MRNLYCIVGPSACGKTTVANALSEKYGYGLVRSYTTRAPRFTGEPGYHFVRPDEFKALGDVYAYGQYDGFEYGVTRDVLDNNDLYVVEPLGLVDVLNRYKGDRGVKVIGLNADSGVLAERMRIRGSSEDAIDRRLKTDADVFKGLHCLADIVLRTDDISIEELCDAIHWHIQQFEDLSKHEFSLRDADGEVISSGKRFYDMEDALEALQEVYPGGLPDGWCVIDETEELRKSYVRAIKKCHPALKISGISVDMESACFTSANGGFLVVPFEYHGRSYVYREHLDQGWIEDAAKEHESVEAIISNAKVRTQGGMAEVRENDLQMT